VKWQRWNSQAKTTRTENRIQNSGVRIQNSKEALKKYLYRHAGANRHPVNNYFDWIPAFAGMTNWEYSGLVQSFLKMNSEF
jgi:hypothetical protein